MAIRVTDHRELLKTILIDHGLRPDSLDLVHDVQAWCREHGIEESNPLRQAKFLRRISDGAPHIVMANVLTDEMVAGGKGLMECLGFSAEVVSLDNDLNYLIHLTLHEVACHVLGTPEQEARDAWAFERVSKYAI